jgi:hypothetical protein
LNDSDPIPIKTLKQRSALNHVRIEEVEYMLTPEELAEAACDDQAWKQIERRAAEECGATCFRDAIDILDGEIAKFPPRGLEAFGDQTEKRVGRDRLKRLVPLFNATILTTFIGHDE